MPTPTPSQIPPPPAFGFDPAHFPTWRPGQDDALLRVIDSKKRISVECLPTGSGKSLLGRAASQLTGMRTVVLTRRKGLQSQMVKDFGTKPGIHDVRGQSSYPCIYSPSVSVELGPCHAGMACHYREMGCHYYDAVKEARDPTTPVTVTNYAFWFMQAKRNQGLGKIDLLICDEAHGILDELSNFLTIEIARFEAERLGLTWPEHYGNNLQLWSDWAKKAAAPAVEKALEEAKEQGKAGATSPAQVRERRRLESMVERIGSLSDAKGRWACDLSQRGGTLRAAPVWPGEYLEKYLWQGTTKILLMSATIRPKLLTMLGIRESEFDYNEVQSSFPLQNRLVHCVDAPRMNHRTSEGEQGIWLDRVDQILGKRLDRKVLLHTGSYERRNFFMVNSRYAGYMIGHTREDLEEVIYRFKVSPPPLILVSQSLTEGFDFPYDECETQIITKIPYPDSRDSIVVARQKDDKDYTSYVAMQQMVQSAGRAVRAADDFAETFIVDGNTKWFMRRNAQFAPAWFNQAVRHVPMVPEPAKKIVR